MAEHYFTGSPLPAMRRARCACRRAGAPSPLRRTPAPSPRRAWTRAAACSWRRCRPFPAAARHRLRLGAIGVSLAAQNPDLFVEMVDVNERAVGLARRNAEANGVYNARALVSDGLAAVEPGLDVCVTNPPIRAGKAVVYGFFAQAQEKLRPGGWLYAVVRKQQGAPSALKYLGEIFALARVREKDAGYWILEAQKAE